MTLLDNASAQTDQADLIILSHVETIRDQLQPATPSAITTMIGGAPLREIARRLMRMHLMGLLEPCGGPDYCYQLTEMGAELLRRDLVGWSPSDREEERRWQALRAKSVRRV
jgi:hypothetical protein